MKNKWKYFQDKSQRIELLDSLTRFEQEALYRDWPLWARINQLPPRGLWRTWLMMGGRGAGKTRAGAQWLSAIVNGDPHFMGDSAGRVALVGQTFQDVRSVMIEGESGLLAVNRKDQRPTWIASRRVLEWPNGAVGQVFSANDPDGLRGNQFGAAWCDELCKWNHLEATWDMLQFCLRLGTDPRQMVTTTPRPLALICKLMKDGKTKITRASTYENENFLAPGFIDFITDEYAGSRLGRQEIDGELIEDREDALWNRALLDQNRIKCTPPLQRIIVAVDPPVTATSKSDSCGIIGVGKDSEGICYVLADLTISQAKPEKWAAKVVSLYHRLGADCVIAEVNQGGDMVQTVLAMADPTLPVRPVRASRGKWLRAEPVAMLYAKGKVRHIGTHPELEDQMCDFGKDGLSNGRSPDRLDALVWAINELAFKPQSRPRIRSG